VLRYTVDGVAPGGRLAWNAVGTAWEVGIARAEVHVVTPTVLDAARCVAGTAGSTAACEMTHAEPGALRARVDGLDAGRAIAVAVRGVVMSSTTTLTPP